MKYKLIFFDLDGTIIDDIEFIWYVLHDHFGVSRDLVKKWHKKFDEGEITYEEWFNEDVKWWKKAGAKKKDFFDAVKKLKLMDGALETLNTLKDKGCKLIIVSGSLNIVVEYFFDKDMFDYVFINELEFGFDDEISGYKVTKHDFHHKATAVRQVAEKEGIDLSECVFVGDNYNDKQAVETAGLGISFNSHSKELDEVADVKIKKKDLREILRYLL